MSDVDLLALYRGAQAEAFRLETHGTYGVPQEKRQRKAYDTSRDVPQDPAIEQEMQIIRDAKGRGVLIHRAHIVDLPIGTGTYLGYEFAAYAADNIPAGEWVGIAARTWHPALVWLDDDFVLFDPGTSNQAVVWMYYDVRGRLTGLRHTTDPGEIERAVRRRDLALAHAIPLADFTALADTG